MESGVAFDFGRLCAEVTEFGEWVVLFVNGMSHFFYGTLVVYRNRNDVRVGVK